MGWVAAIIAVISGIYSAVNQAKARKAAKKQKRKAEAQADAQKGFQLVVEKEVKSLPVAFGRNKLGGVRVYHKVKRNFVYSDIYGTGRKFFANHEASAINGKHYRLINLLSGTPSLELDGTGKPVVYSLTQANQLSVFYITRNEDLWIPRSYKSFDDSIISGVMKTITPNFYWIDKYPNIDTIFTSECYTETKNVKDLQGNIEELVLSDLSMRPSSLEDLNIIFPPFIPGGHNSLGASEGWIYNNYYYIQQVLSQGSLNEIIELNVDDKYYNDPSYKPGLLIHAYKDGGTPCALMTSNDVERANAKFTNMSFLTGAFKLNRDDPQFMGTPEVQAFVEGIRIRSINKINGIYSENSIQTYSNNPARVLLEYLRNSNFGMGLDETQIDYESFYNAMILCDRVILEDQPKVGKIWMNNPHVLGETNTKTRDIKIFECNLSIDTTKDFRSNIEMILGTMHEADLIWSDGKYKLQFLYPRLFEDNNYYSPGEVIQIDDEYPRLFRCITATDQSPLINPTNWLEDVVQITITDDDIQLSSEVTIDYPSADNKLNFATIRYFSEDMDFEEDTVSWPNKEPDDVNDIVYQTYFTEDNNIPSETDEFFYGCSTSIHALAYAEQLVRASRHLITYSMKVSSRIIGIEPGDIVRVNSQIFSIDNILIRISDVETEDGGVVKITGEQFDANILAYNIPFYELETPATSYINNTIKQATDLRLTEIKGENRITYRLSWAKSNDSRVSKYAIKYTTDTIENISSATVWEEYIITYNNQCNIYTLDGTFTFAVVAMTASGRQAPFEDYEYGSTWPVISANVTSYENDMDLKYADLGNKIADLLYDNILTAQEKILLLEVWITYTAQHSQIVSEANALNITLELVSYTEIFDVLNSYMPVLLSDLESNSRFEDFSFVDTDLSVKQLSGTLFRRHWSLISEYLIILKNKMSINSLIPLLPDTPYNLVVTAYFKEIGLTWEISDETNIMNYEVWRNVINDLGTARPVKITTSRFALDAPPDLFLERDFYYWVRGVNKDGQPGEFNAIEGTHCITVKDPSYILQLLQDELTESQLHSDLTSRIDLIDAPSTGLVAKTDLINQQLNNLQGEVAELSNTPSYEDTVTYEIDDLVVYEEALYRALAQTTSNLPTDLNFWIKIGDYTSLGGVVSGHSIQLNDHESRITYNEGEFEIVNGKIDGTIILIDDLEEDVSLQSQDITSIKNTINHTESGNAALYSKQNLINNTLNLNLNADQKWTDIDNKPTNFGGQNLMNPRYSTFEETDTPSVFNSNIITDFSTVGNISPKALRVYATSSYGNTKLGVNFSDYNINLPPNGKWLVSFYIKSSTTNRTMYARLLDDGGFAYGTNTFTMTTIDTWQRKSLICDCSSVIRTKFIIMFVAVSAYTYFTIDGIMIEPVIGDQIEPSPFIRPAFNINYAQYGADVTATSIAFTGLESRVENTEESINTFTQSINTLQSTINNETTGLDATYQKAVTVEGELDTLSGTVGSHTNSLTTLSNTLNLNLNEDQKWSQIFDKPTNFASGNITPSRYSDFEEDLLPPLSLFNCTAIQDNTIFYYGHNSLKLTKTGIDAYCFLSNTIIDFNVKLTPNRKWILSAFINCELTNQPIQLTIRKSDLSYPVIETLYTSAISGQWIRLHTIVDLSSSPVNAGNIKIDYDGEIGSSIWIDGVMLEPLIGDQTTPSIYVVPNLETTFSQYGADITATSDAFVELDTTVTLMDGVVVGHTNSITSLDTAINHPDTGLLKLNSEHSVRLDAIDNIETGALATLGTQVNILSADISNEETGLAAAHAEIITISNDLTTIAGSASSSAEKISQLSAIVEGNIVIFEEKFNSPGGYNSWDKFSGTTNLTLLEDSTRIGGKYLRIGNNSGNDTAWINNILRIPVRDDVIYKITIVIRRVYGSGTFFGGFTGFNESLTKTISSVDNEYPLRNVCASFYTAANSNPLSNPEWTTLVGYSRSINGPEWPEEAVGQRQVIFTSKVKYISPLAICNYNGLAGITDIDHIKVEAIGGTNSAVMEIRSSVMSNIDGRLAAQHTLKTDVNGKLAGFGLANDGTISSFDFLADKFFFSKPDGTGTKLLMAIDGTHGVIIDNALIKNLTAANIVAGSITADRFSVVDLSSITANMGAITAGTILMSNTSSWVKSNNYIANSAGFLIRGDGFSEFQNVKVRGDVEATSLKANTLMVNTGNIVDLSVNSFKIANGAIVETAFFKKTTNTTINAGSTVNLATLSGFVQSGYPIQCYIETTFLGATGLNGDKITNIRFEILRSGAVIYTFPWSDSHIHTVDAFDNEIITAEMKVVPAHIIYDTSTITADLVFRVTCPYNGDNWYGTFGPISLFLMTPRK
jgi:hypothetical protein